jgi:hypothetical protein
MRFFTRQTTNIYSYSLVYPFFCFAVNRRTLRNEQSVIWFFFLLCYKQKTFLIKLNSFLNIRFFSQKIFHDMKIIGNIIC